MNIKELSDEKLLQLYSQSLDEIKRRDGKRSPLGMPLDYDDAQGILFEQWWDGCKNCEWESGNSDCLICKGEGIIHRDKPLDNFDERIEENGGEIIWADCRGSDDETIKSIGKTIKLLGGDAFENPMTEGCGDFSLIVCVPKMIREYRKNPPAPSCDCDSKALLTEGCKCGKK